MRTITNRERMSAFTNDKLTDFIFRIGGDCDKCPIEKCCREMETTQCDRVFREWLKRDATL